MRYKRSVYRTFALITQLGLSMLTPVFLCTFLGVFLEDKFSLHVFIPLLILGVLAGGRNVYVLAAHANEDQDDGKDHSNEK
ncbi:MAG: AtpZ/AtpI family protein [Lachnospiraceae bacterium]